MTDKFYCTVDSRSGQTSLSRELLKSLIPVFDRTIIGQRQLEDVPTAIRATIDRLSEANPHWKRLEVRTHGFEAGSDGTRLLHMVFDVDIMVINPQRSREAFTNMSVIDFKARRVFFDRSDRSEPLLPVKGGDK